MCFAALHIGYKVSFEEHIHSFPSFCCVQSHAHVAGGKIHSAQAVWQDEPKAIAQLMFISPAAKRCKLLRGKICIA